MSDYFPTDYEHFIYKSRYSRWLENEKRRENWPETVKRYFDFFEDHLKKEFNYNLDKKLRLDLEKSILNFDVMPSMRCLMTAGPALERCNVAGYNCSYLPVDSIRSFDECMYILMCGAGVGFSVEERYVSQLPIINEHFENSETTIVVADSKSGWARAFKELISMLYSGQVPKWDLSRLRPAGAPLKTFGGRSSGPEPLNNLFNFTVEIFKKASGRRLNTLECHDLMCKIGEVVVVGGVRRSALISLSDLGDDRMRYAKAGKWWEDNVQRRLSNNSAVYNEKPDVGTFLKEWTALYNSKSGERGIFNRQSAINKVAENGRRETDHLFGTNPCSEIILRPFQFCNLTEVVVREKDDLDDLKRKVIHATILGTFQSTLTNFKYLRKVWKNNTEEENLLGVSLTGIADNQFTLDENPDIETFLIELKQSTVYTNKVWSEKLKINQSTAITCVKPSGTVSQLVNSASGIHPRHSPYYIRTVRADNNDPLTKFLKDQNIPNEPDVMASNSTTVFSFPIKSPQLSLIRKELTAIEHLELWKLYAKYWCEHKPSVTISVKEDEWLEVGSWVYNNFEFCSGISFLPYAEHTYQQAPYQEISLEEYNKLVQEFPKDIDWDKLAQYEAEDNTTASQELACTGNSCEIVDLK